MSYELAQYIFGTPIGMARVALAPLVVFLLAAAWFDWRQKRIPNWLVVSGAVVALALHSLLPVGEGFLANPPGALGFWSALGGMAFGLVALLPIYLLRGMGAGDVKLLAMVGAFLGPVHVWWALLATAFAGGALAVAVALHFRVLGRVWKNVRLMTWNLVLGLGGSAARVPEFSVTSVAQLPYGVAIATGSLGYLVIRAQNLGLL